MLAGPIVVRNNFQEGCGHYMKGENKWENSGSLDLNELDTEGLKATQRNE